MWNFFSAYFLIGLVLDKIFMTSVPNEEEYQKKYPGGRLWQPRVACLLLWPLVILVMILKINDGGNVKG